MVCGANMLHVSLLCIFAVFNINAAISVSPQQDINDTVEGVESLAIPVEEPSTVVEPSILLEEPSIIVEGPSTTLGDPVHPPIDISDKNLNHSLTYDGLYEQGVKHYLENEWTQCAGYMQMAIEDYHWYRETLTSCRRDCREEAEAATPLTTPRTPDQVFFETYIKNALCLLKCRSLHFSSRQNHVAPTSVDHDFEDRKPYDYLQLCLYKLGRYQDAADCAVTVLARQPDHKIMANNLRQYIDDYSADPDLLKNLELQEFAMEYVQGDRDHADENYEMSVQHMETALRLYWKALDDCRLRCEEPFDQGWFPDFVTSVANHYTFTFRCKRRCPSNLSNLYGEEIDNFLPSIFNYLQYGYQKLNNIPSACAATQNFLELMPADASMIKNKQFYLTEYQKMDRFFVSSTEVAAHAARERYENNLLHFIDTEFVFLEDSKNVKLQPQGKANRTMTLRETLSDMLTSVFAGQPILEDFNKGEL